MRGTKHPPWEEPKWRRVVNVTRVDFLHEKYYTSAGDLRTGRNTYRCYYTIHLVRVHRPDKEPKLLREDDILVVATDELDAYKKLTDHLTKLYK